VKFIIDMPLSPRLVEWLNEQGHSSIHATKAGLDRASDVEILQYARKNEMVILTADLDYPRMLALTGASEPGVILFRGGNYSEREIEERLAVAFQAIAPEELASSVVVIEKERIRKRRLPLE